MVLGIRLVRLGTVAVVGFVAFQACSAAVSEPPGAGGGGMATTGGSGGSAGTHVLMPDLGAPSGGSSASFTNPLCAVRNCLPDSETACAGFEPADAQPLELGGAGGAAGASSTDTAPVGGAPGAGGVGGESADGGGGDAGAGGAFMASSGGALGSGGEANAGTAGQPALAYACRVMEVSSELGSACGPIGAGELDTPCFSGGDCRAGLACVRDGAVARCRQYCCEGEAACADSGMYCAERYLRDDSLTARNATARVPVCVAAEQCDLSEPYPCPEGRVCQCPGNLACLVVRNDGVTACVMPGSGQPGEACPCQHGSVCSEATSTCLALCTFDDADSGLGCKSGKCQPAAQLPAGFGVCIDY